MSLWNLIITEMLRYTNNFIKLNLKHICITCPYLSKNMILCGLYVFLEHWGKNIRKMSNGIQRRQLQIPVILRKKGGGK